MAKSKAAVRKTQDQVGEPGTRKTAGQEFLEVAPADQQQDRAVYGSTSRRPASVVKESRRSEVSNSGSKLKMNMRSISKLPLKKLGAAQTLQGGFKGKKQKCVLTSDDQCYRNFFDLLFKFLEGPLLPANRETLVLMMLDQRTQRMAVKFFRQANALDLARMINKNHKLEKFVNQIGGKNMDMEKY